MGKRGPPKRPVEVKMAAGTYRKDRDGVALDVPKEVPTPPDWLSESARPHWDEIAAMLNDANLLTLLDKNALGLLCDTFAQYLELRKQTERSGFVSCSDKGTESQNPSAVLMNKCKDTIIKLLREFGMTVSSRANLAVSNKDKPSNDKERFLKRIIG